jgi:hypothetical protein
MSRQMQIPQNSHAHSAKEFTYIEKEGFVQQPSSLETCPADATKERIARRSARYLAKDRRHAFRDAQEQSLEMERLANLMKELKKKQARISYLRREQCLRQVASGGEITRYELLLERKLHEEEEQLHCLRESIQGGSQEWKQWWTEYCRAGDSMGGGRARWPWQVQHPSRQRPRSANATCGRRPTPVTSGVCGFSADAVEIPAYSVSARSTEMRAFQRHLLMREMAKQGPPVSIVDHREGGNACIVTKPIHPPTRIALA